MEVQLHAFLTWILIGDERSYYVLMPLSFHHQGKRSWCPWLGDPVGTRAQSETFKEERLSGTEPRFLALVIILIIKPTRCTNFSNLLLE